MGCDIHCYAETRKNGRWVADAVATFVNTREGDDDNGWNNIDMNSAYSDRNYGLFGLLAGVRLDVSHVTEPFAEYGFPDDASSEVEELYQSWGGDAHTTSRLTCRQLREKAAELMLLSGEDAAYLRGCLVDLMKEIGWPDNCDGDAHRIVFWFDN